MPDMTGRSTGNRLARRYLHPRAALATSLIMLYGNKACKRRTHAMETTSGLAQYSTHSLDPAPPPYARSHVVHTMGAIGEQRNCCTLASAIGVQQDERARISQSRNLR
jgi:hypothetical protein